MGGGLTHAKTCPLADRGGDASILARDDLASIAARASKGCRYDSPPCPRAAQPIPCVHSGRPPASRDHLGRHQSGATAYGLRVAADGVLVGYSGDTAWTETLLDIASETDVFVCEAYFDRKQVPYHLSYQRLLAERDRLTSRPRSR